MADKQDAPETGTIALHTENSVDFDDPQKLAGRKQFMWLQPFCPPRFFVDLTLHNYLPAQFCSIDVMNVTYPSAKSIANDAVAGT